MEARLDCQDKTFYELSLKDLEIVSGKART
jgi:hypothetical protein